MKKVWIKYKINSVDVNLYTEKYEDIYSDEDVIRYVDMLIEKVNKSISGANKEKGGTKQ